VTNASCAPPGENAGATACSPSSVTRDCRDPSGSDEERMIRRLLSRRALESLREDDPAVAAGEGRLSGWDGHENDRRREPRDLWHRR
jgi:hypothetical protein